MEPRFRGGGGDIDKPDLLYNTALYAQCPAGFWHQVPAQKSPRGTTRFWMSRVFLTQLGKEVRVGLSLTS